MWGGIIFMVVNFMKNSSPSNYLTKQVSTSKQVQCDIKGNCSILSPILIVQDLGITTSNYCQIPDFGNRYYFVTDIITLNEATLEVRLSVDVLMSYKTDILASKAIISRNQNMYNRYVPDPKFTVLSYERIQTKQFPNKFPDNGKFVLIVAGS